MAHQHVSTADAEQLAAFLATARTDHAVAVVVRGPPASGRSLLLDDLADHAVGWSVLRLPTAPGEHELPGAGIDALLHGIAGLRPGLAAHLPSAAVIAAADDPVARLHRYGELLESLERAAREQPLLILVDDAEHLDDRSVDALTFVARRVESRGLMLVFCVCREEAPRFERVGLRRVEVDPLTADRAQRLVQRRLGRRLAAPVAAQLLRRLDGHGRALIAVCERLQDQDLLGYRNLPIPLPFPRDTASSELDDLSDRTLRALGLVAISAVTTPQVISNALETADLALGDLEPAEELGLLRATSEGITFRDEAVRAAAADLHTPVTRRADHAALAAALDADAHADVAARAHHLAEASLVGDATLLDLLRSVATVAVNDADPAAAARALAAASLRAGSGDERGELALTAAEQATSAGHVEWATHLLDDAALAATTAELRGRIELARDHVRLAAGPPLPLMRDLLRRARRTEDHDPAQAARLLSAAAAAGLAAGRVTDARDAARRAVALGPRGSLDAASAHAWLGMCEVVAGDTVAATASLEAAARGWAGTDPDGPSALAQACTLVARIWLGEVEPARVRLSELVANLESSGATGLLPQPLNNLALAEYRRGWWQAASVHATRVLALTAEAGALAGYAHAVQALITSAQGLRGRCEHHLAALRGTIARTGTESLVPYAAAAAGALELGLGRADVAVALLEEAERTAAAAGVVPASIVGCAGDLVQAYVEAGRPAAAAARIDQLEGEASQPGGVWAEAVALRGRALLSTGDRCHEALARSSALFAEMPMPFELARNQLVAAQVYAEVGDTRAARQELERARAGMEVLGVVGWLRRIDEVDQRLDRNGPAGDLVELTAQERRVVRLVLDGASNREVADVLVLSVKTVEYHLHHVYRKFGVTSRAELLRLLDIVVPDLSEIP